MREKYILGTEGNKNNETMVLDLFLDTGSLSAKIIIRSSVELLFGSDSKSKQEITAILGNFVE